MNGWEALCVIVTILGAVALACGGAYLAMNGHPWFALLVFLMAGSIRLHIKDDKEAK